jgi:signal transduction histidine kinase
MSFRSTTDSRQALTIFREYQPDIVLLDLMMPHIDGFAVMAQIQGELPPDSFLPIVVLTADITSKTRKKALQLGARDFLLKPFDADELDLRVRNLLETRFLHIGLHNQNRGLESRVLERTQELEEAVVELRESQRQAIHQERLHAFVEMAGGVAHDFNNVLTILLGYCDILLEPGGLDDPEKARKDLEVLHRAATDAVHVVQRLRRFYRPREEDEVYGSVCLAQLVKEVVDLAQPKWQSIARGQGSDIKLEINVPAELVIQGNAPELREMLLNLVFNAVDAMPSGGKLLLSAEEMGEDALLQVTDTGLGMTPEVRDRCLEPFFTTKGDKGTGLGLAMVFGILRRHEGAVDIVSSVGEGTTFSIILPREGSHKAVARQSTTPSLPPMRILFADDDPNVRKLIPLLLEGLGHTVTVAADGVEALDLYSSGRRFDVVLTDLSMPRLNGEALAHAVKQISREQPVIILTGFGDMLLKDGKKPDTVDLLLSKPITSEGLNAALAEVTK